MTSSLLWLEGQPPGAAVAGYDGRPSVTTSSSDRPARSPVKCTGRPSRVARKSFSEARSRIGVPSIATNTSPVITPPWNAGEPWTTSITDTPVSTCNAVRRGQVRDERAERRGPRLDPERGGVRVAVDVDLIGLGPVVVVLARVDVRVAVAIDEVRIYDRALDGAEVLAIATQ